MTALSIGNWFAAAYREIGLDGSSSHSGRRTFITGAARLDHKTGGSLRDVQLLGEVGGLFDLVEQSGAIKAPTRSRFGQWGTRALSAAYAIASPADQLHAAA
jgi:hypothetical protein